MLSVHLRMWVSSVVLSAGFGVQPAPWEGAQGQDLGV